MTKTFTTGQILMLPMLKNDADAATIGEYFIRQIQTLWHETEGFSGKRPFGNSGWETDITKELVRHGVITGTFEVDEEPYYYLDDYDAAADQRIMSEIFAFLLKADWTTLQEYKEPEDWYVVYVDLDLTGTPRLQDAYKKGMTKEAAEYAAKESNNDDGSGNWRALHIPK